MSVRAAIIGPTGYTGLHLIRILSRHPGAHLTYLASRRDPPPNICDEFAQLAGRIDAAVAQCQPIDVDAIERVADIAFTALPHRAAMRIVPELLDAGLRVIDLSADYRFDDAQRYESAYQHAHEDPTNLARAVYGLPELLRDKIKPARLVANPGCYPTAAALAIAPLLREQLIDTRGSIIINAASGITGAGRTPKPNLHFPHVHNGYAAYGAIGGHRHQPEIEQTLSSIAGSAVRTLFVPHLLPIDQGILETIYLTPTSDVTTQTLHELFERTYDGEPFVRVRTEPPNVRDVRDSNFCDLCVAVPAHARHIVVFSAIDNMIKGASGQAVQNMNLMFGLTETAGLE
jgi:N-acetyl-gamma-glutamyl-phosphate reductase